ncbi:MAG: T9SS type A sorting domain-containing protein [Cryomorphaceae bacterium]|nr:T9SS type A sorting domain-containing protein [Cryomorphaceae bacterium]
MKTIFLIAIALISFDFNTNAQYGSIDLTFNGSGYNLVELSNGVYLTSDMLVLPDDRILVAGRRGSSLGTPGFPVVMRFKADGSLDESFGVNGISDINWAEIDDYINSIIVSSDNHIYLTGYGTQPVPGFNDNQAFGVVAKLTYDGIPVTEFGDNGVLIFIDDSMENVTDFDITDIAEDEQGEFVICGVVTQDNSSNSLMNFIAKIKDDGSYSQNFVDLSLIEIVYNQLPQAFDEKPRFIEFDEAGNILIAAQCYNGDGLLGVSVVRFTSFGILDTNFNTNGVAWNTDEWGSDLSSFDLLDDGSMLLASEGDFGYAGSPTKVYKFDANGFIDNTFGENGYQLFYFDYSTSIPSRFYDLKPTSDGFFLVEKVINPPLFAPIGEGMVIAKCKNDGTLDTDFGIDGKSYFIPTMQIQPTRIDVDNAGRIVVCGHTTNPSFNFFVARFNSVPDNVGEFEKNRSLVMYPNPTSGLVNLNVDAPSQVLIFDLHGALVLSTSSNGNKPLDLNELPAGFYAIQAISENTILQGKLIID